MRKWAICSAIVVAALVVLGLLWLLRPSKVIEIQARVLPAGWMECVIADLDGDGNDEIVVETKPVGWFAEPKTEVIAVTMRNRKFVTFPVPLTYDVRAAKPKGRWLVGRTNEGDVAVVELLPNGEWQKQILLPRETFEGNQPHRIVGEMQPSYTIGDLDGNKVDDDIVVQLGSKGERILWFKRRQDGKWRKESEITLLTGNVKLYSSWGIYMHGVTLWADIGIPTRERLLRLFCWDGRLQVGRMDERVYIFEGDWTNDGQMEKLLVRFLEGDEKVYWQIESKQASQQSNKGEWLFRGWQVMNARATDKLGDGRWHLVLAMEKTKPVTVRVVDCQFEPRKGWQITELFKQRVNVKSLTKQTLQIPKHIFLSIGDTNDDGQNEIEVAFGQWIRNWLLYRDGNQWRAKPLTFKKGHIEIAFFPLLHSADKMWFERRVERTPRNLITSLHPIGELGTFDTRGRWKPIVTYSGAYSWFVPQLHDLNNDDSPEFVTFEGLMRLHPVLYYRSREGQWKRVDLRGRTVWRLLNALWQGSDHGVGIVNDKPYLVQWDGKSWFVIVWTDGFIQAVTLGR